MAPGGRGATGGAGGAAGAGADAAVGGAAVGTCALAGTATPKHALSTPSIEATRHVRRSLIASVLAALAGRQRGYYPAVTANPIAARIAPAGEPLELLFERAAATPFDLPEALQANYGGTLSLPASCVYANFVASLDGIVALPGDTESGQIISGRNAADRFVMGVLRSCADAVLLGAGTFRNSGGHLWHPDRIYPAAGAQFAEVRQRLGLQPKPRLVLLSASGDLKPDEPALEDAWLFSTEKGAAALKGRLPSSTRVTTLASGQIRPAEVLAALRSDGLQRILTEGGPSLFSELAREQLVDELFLTSSPALFGRFAGDERKSLTDGLDLGGARLDLHGVRRHGSHLFLRYAFNRYKT